MKRSVTLSGHRTSVSLEAPFWDALKEIADIEQLKPTEIIAKIDATRLPEDNLSSAVRIYVLTFYKDRAKVQTDASLRESRE